MKIVHLLLLGTYTDNRCYQENLLTKYHVKIGHMCTVITSEWMQADEGLGYVKDIRKEYIDTNGVKVIRLPIRGRDNINRKFIRYKGLYRAIEREFPDFVFIHGVNSLDNTVIVRFLRQHPKVIAVADNHADYSNSATNIISKYLLHGLLWKHYAKLLDPVIETYYGVMPSRVDFLCERYQISRSRCKLLLMGGDDELVQYAANEEIRAEVRLKYGFTKDDFLIVTGGKINKSKAQTLLLMKAVRELPKKVKLIVFGAIDDSLQEQFDSLCDGKRIHFAGWKEGHDTYPIIAAADLAVYPGRHSTLWEQTVAQGIPLLCKNWPGTHHVDIGGNVIFLNTDSEDEIKHQLYVLISDGEKYRIMRKNAVEGELRKRFYYSSIAHQCLEGT